MTIINFIVNLLRIIAINIGLLLASALTDIVLSSLLFRFSSGALTLVCFAVTGVFAGLFCYNSSVEKSAKEKRAQISLHVMLMVAVFSILLFYPIASLSDSEYNWPCKTFAVTQLLMVVFLWKQKFYKDV